MTQEFTPSISRITEMLNKNPRFIGTLLKLGIKEDTICEAVLETLEDLHPSDLTKSLNVFVEQLLKYFSEPASFSRLVEKYPFVITQLKGVQTLELCRIALKKTIETDKYNCSFTFRELEYHDREMAIEAVINDARCYKHVNPEFQTRRLMELAVECDPYTIEILGENPPLGLALKAVRMRPKVIEYIKCSSIADLEKLQIEAITLNLQAMPSRPVSKRVVDTFKELSIKSNYFDDYWTPKFNLSQEQLYKMLVARSIWLDNHLIFNLLDDEHKKLALQDTNIEIKGLSKPSTIKNIVGTTDLELVYLVLKNATLEEAQETLLDSLTYEQLLELADMGWSQINLISPNFRTEELVEKVIKHTPSAAIYVSNLTPKHLEVLREYLELKDTDSAD